MNLIFPCACLSLVFALPAGAQIYRCVDAEEHVTYATSALNKNCKLLPMEPVSSIPAPAKKRAASPTDFPKVSDDAQKARDSGRRVILEQELSEERQKLAAAQQKLKEQEQTRLGNEKNFQKYQERLQPYKEEVSLRERNISEINKELSGLK
ncbi:MAG: DUF4124 domain-containing protein [Zoogloeaceae bacterium]|nr:DUF4124 domain-containing protein [Zoogloeaceae bacterium]